MTDRPGKVPDDETIYLVGLDMFTQTWPLVGNDLPTEVHAAIFGELERLGEPTSWSDDTQRHNERLLLCYEGLLASYYHRDRIESIERGIIERIRGMSPIPLPRGGTSSMRMPVVGHEFVAYLLAARRTLDYLARGVGDCFGRSGVYKITKLSAALGDAQPADLTAKVAEECAGLTARFPHLLRHEDRISDRDRAAHYWPIEPAHLLVVHFHDGRLGIELLDGGAGYLPGLSTLDADRMSRDQALLTSLLDAQLADLSAFCVRLLGIAVDAELRLREAG